MRHFITGLALFVLLAVFVRGWYYRTKSEQRTQDRLEIIQTANEAEVVADDYQDAFYLEEDLLLDPVHYDQINRLIDLLIENPSRNLTVSIPENAPQKQVENIFLTLCSDQGIEATRIHYLRKLSENTLPYSVSMRIE